MKKIKKFKINCRSREILRILKTTTEISQMTPQLEEAVQRESLRLRGMITPAAIYDTHPKDKMPGDLAVSAPGKWIAASIYLVTIGDEVEEEIRESRLRGERMLSSILHAIAVEALDQSARFVQRLVGEEAGNEGCELTKYQQVGADGSWEQFFRVLPGDKIGVSRSDNGAFDPLYSSGGISYWIPLKKRGAKQGG